MRKKIIFAMAVLFTISYTFAADMEMGKVSIVDGAFSEMNYEKSPFGGLKGSVKLKIGTYIWHPDNVWLVPEGMLSDQFRYTGDYYSLPSEMNLTNNCKSNVYYNSTLDKYAFKSDVGDDGSYCILGNSGNYNVMAEY